MLQNNNSPPKCDAYGINKRFISKKGPEIFALYPDPQCFQIVVTNQRRGKLAKILII